MSSYYKVVRRIRLNGDKGQSSQANHFRGNEYLASFASLEIAQYANDTGFYLFYYDANGKQVTDTYHDDLETALDQANFEFGVDPSDWKIVDEIVALQTPSKEATQMAERIRGKLSQGARRIDVDQFEFGYKASKDDFVAVLPMALDNEEKLLSAMAHELRFPEYFGMNWDALYDCLRDFNWIDQKNIVIVHQDVPLMNSKKEQLIYLWTLFDTVGDWKKDTEHSVTVVFPKSSKDYLEKVSKLINDDSRGRG